MTDTQTMFYWLNFIYTISDVCVQSLKSFFPNQVHKIQLMENITSPQLIQRMSNEQILDMSMDEQTKSFLTIGHISVKKGTDLAIKAAAILKKKGIKFKWFFFGKRN